MRLIGSRTATIFTPRANQPQVCCAVLQWVLHCDVSIVNATILPPRSCATSVLKCATSILPCGTLEEHPVRNSTNYYTNDATCVFEAPTKRRLLFGAQPQAGVCVPT